MRINKSLKILFLYNGIFVFASSLIGPLYALFVEKYDTTPLGVSITWFAFLISSTIVMLLIQWLGDNVKEKEYFLLGGFLIRSIIWFLFPIIPNIYILILFQVFLGIGEALGSPSFDAIFAEHLDKGKHINEYTTWKLISSLVDAFAVLIGGVLVSYLGFNILFYVMGTLALFSFFGVLFKPRNIL